MQRKPATRSQSVDDQITYTPYLPDQITSDRNVKNMFYLLFWLSNNAPLDKNTIFCWFYFPQVVQKQTRHGVQREIKWSFDGQLYKKYSYQKLLKCDNSF